MTACVYVTLISVEKKDFSGKIGYGKTNLFV